MEIKINIDESRFQEVLEKELGAFTQEELHEIIAGALKEYLSREEFLKEFVNKQEVDRWGCTVKGSSTMEKLIQSVNLTDIFADAKEKIKEIILKDDVLKNIGNELLVKVFTDKLRNTIYGDFQFMETISDMVAQKMSEKMR